MGSSSLQLQHGPPGISIAFLLSALPKQEPHNTEYQTSCISC